MNRAKLDEAVAAVNRPLHAAGYECIEAEWSAHDRILRLYVDYADQSRGAIDLDGCVAASHLIVDMPELDELIPGKYTLEVSSPGVDRPLRRRADFEKAIEQTIEVRLSEKVMNRKNGKGRLARLEGAGDDTLLTMDTAEGIWTFPLASLLRAHLVYDWGDA